MDLKLYNEMLDTKETIAKYLVGKEREFSILASKLSSIGIIVSVDSVDILSSLGELQSQMTTISNEYMKAKGYASIMKNILTQLQVVGLGSGKPLAEYNLLKDMLKASGIIKSTPVQEEVNTLKKTK